MGFISHDSFNSLVKTTPSQSVIDIPLDTDRGFIFITGGGNNQYGLAWFRASSSASVNTLLSQSGFDVSIGVADGTTGSDGKITLFVSDGRLQIENRTDSNQNIKAMVIG